MPLYDCQASLCCFAILFTSRLLYVHDPNTEPKMTSPRMIAAKGGQTTFTGRPCPKHPHAVRYVSSGQCKVCTLERMNRNSNAIRDALQQARAARRGA